MNPSQILTDEASPPQSYANKIRNMNGRWRCTCRSGSRRRSACNCPQVRVEGCVEIGGFAAGWFGGWAIGLGCHISCWGTSCIWTVNPNLALTGSWISVLVLCETFEDFRIFSNSRSPPKTHRAISRICPQSSSALRCSCSSSSWSTTLTQRHRWWSRFLWFFISG